MDDLALGISVETVDSTGDVLAVYFSVRRGKSATVKEFSGGAAFADYDKNGKLLGIELLGPCSIEVLDKISRNSQVRRFIKNTMPRAMLASA